MPFEEILDDLAKRREKALKMGKPEILKRMKDTISPNFFRIRAKAVITS